MKKHDFIKSLQEIKSQIIHSQKKPKKTMLERKENSKKSICSCTDSNGESKYLYHSKQEMEYLLSSKHISLTSYPCPFEKGWHITKG